MSLQKSDRIQLILNGPIHSMLFKLAAPNMVSVFFMLIVGFAEPFFAGKLGIVSLASVAITYPLVSLSGMIGAGAIGGGVVSSLSRSIGKNDLERANLVIWHSFLIYLAVAITFFIAFVFFSRNLFVLLGPEEEVIDKPVETSLTKHVVKSESRIVSECDKPSGCIVTEEGDCPSCREVHVKEKTTQVCV